MASITIDDLIDYLDTVTHVQIELEEARGVQSAIRAKLRNVGRFPAEPIKGEPIINWKRLRRLNIFFLPLIGFLLLAGLMESSDASRNIFQFLFNFIRFCIFPLAYFAARRIYITRRTRLNDQAFEVEMQLYQDDVAERQRLQSILRQVLPRVNGAVSSCENTLSQLYNLSYLHSDYWNLPACATFLEWFDKGMTSSLMRNGTDPGAYVMYEEKLRAGEIIDRLDRIEGQLTTISNNQRILINAVNEIKQTVNSMNAKLDNIETYSAITAFASSITAYNTSTLRDYFPEVQTRD